MKMTYEQPQLRAHGRVENLTHGMTNGAGLDQFFPVGTPRGELTFS